MSISRPVDFGPSVESLTRSAPGSVVGLADGVAVALLVGALVVAVAGVVGATAAGAVIVVMTLAWHDTEDPPGFPLPLHWLTLIGIARLTLDAGSTEQSTEPPPPLAEPLHWVTVAALAVAGEGVHRSAVEAPELTHWLVLARVSGFASGVLALMWFVIVTSQLIECAASLSELLHCWTVVTRLLERVVNVPFGVEQGPSRQSRVTVVTELVPLLLIVLTTVTVHLRAVVAPSAPGPWPLHWSTDMLAACAAVGWARAAVESAPVTIIRASTITRQGCRTDGFAAGIVTVLMWPPCKRRCEAQLDTGHEWSEWGTP